MAEDQKTEAATPPSMRIVNQFIRDLSFENFAAQNRLEGDAQPEVNVQVNLDASKRDNGQFEVVLKVNVTSNIGETKVFLLEIDYAGLFVIENVPDEQMHPFLMIECPRMLFPFVRQLARNLTADGGFPPLNIDTIDFLSMYRSELARRVAAQQAAKPN